MRARHRVEGDDLVGQKRRSRRRSPREISAVRLQKLDPKGRKDAELIIQL